MATPPLGYGMDFEVLGMRFLLFTLIGLLASGCQAFYADNPDYDALAQPIRSTGEGLLMDGSCAPLYTHVEMHRPSPAMEGYSVIVDVWREGPGLGGVVTYLDDDGAERLFEIRGWDPHPQSSPGFYRAHVTLLEYGSVVADGQIGFSNERAASIDLTMRKESAVRMYRGRVIVPLDGDDEQYLRSESPDCL